MPRLAVGIAGASLGALLAVAVGIIALLQTDVGGRLAARALKAMLSTPGGTAIRIGRLGPGLPFRLDAEALSVADRQGEWLAIESASVRWRPHELMRGRLAISEAVLSGVLLSRLPAGPSEADDDGTGPPSLPLDFSVGRLALEDVVIGPAVAGETVSVRARGQLGVERDGQVRTDLDVTRTNGVGGSVRMAVLREPEGRRLAVDFRAAEPEGGLIPRLLGLGGQHPVSLTFAGDGPVVDWTGRLEGSIGDAVDARMRMTTEASPEGLTVHLAGVAHLAALLGEKWRPLVSQGVRFSLAVRRPEDRVLVVPSAEVWAPGMRAHGSGAIALTDERLNDVRLDVVVDDTAALAPLLGPARLDAAAVQAELSGPWLAPVAAIAVDVENLHLGDASIAALWLKARTRPASVGESSRINIGLESALAGARVGATDLDAILGGQIRLRASGAFVSSDAFAIVDEIELSSSAIRAEGRATYHLDAGAGDAELRAILPSLAVLAPALAEGLSGTAALNVEAQLRQGGLEGALGLAFADFRAGIPAADILLGPNPSGRAAIRADPSSGSVRIDHAVIVGQGLRAEGLATLEGGRVDARYRVDVPEIKSAAEALNVAAFGAVQLDGTLSGTSADPDVRASLTLADGHIAKVLDSPIRAELSVQHIVSQPQGLIVATGAVEGQPLRIDLPFITEQGGVLVAGPLEATAGGLAVSGGLSLAPDGRPIRGAITLHSGDGGLPAEIGDYRLEGEAVARMVLGERSGDQTVDVEIEGRSLALSRAGGPAATAERLTLRASVEAGKRGHVDLLVASPAIGGVSVDVLEARLTGSPEAAEFRVSAGLPGDPAGRIRVEGALQRQYGATRMTIAALDGQAAGQALRLRRPLVLSIANGQTTLGELEVAIGDGLVSARGQTGAGETRGSLTISKLPLALAGALRPELRLVGTLDAEGSIGTKDKELVGRLSVNLSGVRGGWAEQVPPLEAAVVVTLDDAAATLDLQIPRLGDAPLSLQASVPARVDARTFALQISDQSPLRGRFVWFGSVARLWELLPLAEQRLTGDASIDLALTGTVASPRIVGDAALTNCRFEHFVTGTVIDHLSIIVRSTGAGDATLSLRGDDGARGAVTGEGRITLTTGMAPLVELVVTFTEATLVRRDDVTAALSGIMTYRQNDQGGTLVGDIAADRADVRLVDRLPPSVVVLDVTEINLPPGSVPQAAEPPPASAAPAITLDIAARLPGRVFVRGRGLESEWDGNLELSGSSADVRVVGVVAVRSGTFDFAGRTFTLQTGQIGFTGGKSFNPTLNVEAVRRTADLTAVIRVTGTALEPDIELTSNPALPESEVLSRILFDKGVAKLGPIEVAQLGLALDTLASGESLSEDALSYARDLLGLDVLTLEAGEEEGEGPALGLGRYVADGVYVGARQGAADESTSGTVEIEVLPGFAIESEVSDSTEGPTGALGLRWKWDY